MEIERRSRNKRHAIFYAILFAIAMCLALYNLVAWQIDKDQNSALVALMFAVIAIACSITAANKWNSAG
jgi:uncharacterized membrane protein YccC